MKTIGLIGGMSWESSLEYYRIINETVKKRLGGLHSAKSLMVSVDFAEIEELQSSGDWETATQKMIEAAQQVERGGADFVVLCTNTMHRTADDVQHAINIPLLHIADATAAKIKAAGHETIGLLGTRYTMEQFFYRGRLESEHNLNVLVPDDAGRTTVHNIIYQELVLGEIKDASRVQYQEIMQQLIDNGVESIILGCTEIELLIKQKDCPVPIFDTTMIHAITAVDWALEGIPTT
jgi:aspartate racemase